MQVTNETRFNQMSVGDRMPSGAKISGIISLPSKTREGVKIVTITVEKDGDLKGTYAGNWADETWGDAVKRGEFYAGLVDHS